MGDVPAVAVDTPAAADAADLLDDATPVAADAVATESKPADDKKAGADGEGETPDLLADDDDGKTPDKADGQATDKKDETPETYEAFTFPEGVIVDEGVLAKATPILREIGADQEKAQKLVSFFADVQQEQAAQQLAGFNQVKKDWQAEIKADPEFGGDKLPETLGAAKDFLARFGDAKLRSDLKEWGWANHPGLIRALAKARAHLSEDTLVTADATAQPSKPKSIEERLWGAGTS